MLTYDQIRNMAYWDYQKRKDCDLIKHTHVKLNM